MMFQFRKTSNLKQYVFFRLVSQDVVWIIPKFSFLWRIERKIPQILEIKLNVTVSADITNDNWLKLYIRLWYNSGSKMKKTKSYVITTIIMLCFVFKDLLIYLKSVWQREKLRWKEKEKKRERRREGEGTEGRKEWEKNGERSLIHWFTPPRVVLSNVGPGQRQEALPGLSGGC